MIHDTAIPLAIVVASLMLVMGCSLLFSANNWLKLFADYTEQPQRMLMPGLAMTVFGLIVVFNHNLWSGGWLIAVTLSGWLVLIKGLSCLFGPGLIHLHERFSDSLIKFAMRIAGSGLIVISIILLLTITGRS